MTNTEMKATIRQMLADWNQLTEAQKQAAQKAAAERAGQ